MPEDHPTSQATSPTPVVVTVARVQPPDTATAPPPRRPSVARIVMAFLIAGVSDMTSVITEFIPPIQWAVDLGTGVLLAFILGPQWLLLPAMVAEAIPGVAVFPLWILDVASILVYGTIRRSVARP